MVFRTGWRGIHSATGLGVVAALSARNLEPVARAMRNLFPARELIVAADDDCHLRENLGLGGSQEGRWRRRRACRHSKTGNPLSGVWDRFCGHSARRGGGAHRDGAGYSKQSFGRGAITARWRSSTGPTRTATTDLSSSSAGLLTPAKQVRVRTLKGAARKVRKVRDRTRDEPRPHHPHPPFRECGGGAGAVKDWQCEKHKSSVGSGSKSAAFTRLRTTLGRRISGSHYGNYYPFTETIVYYQRPLADGVGFEPTVSFHPRRFSRPLP